MVEYTCCFIGHRTINETEELKVRLYDTIESLIVNERVDTFLFGSKSRFNDLCLEIVSILKEKYPHIKRVYVRAEFPYISDSYRGYLSESYKATYYPEKIMNSGRASYIQRNYEMIENSQFCIAYYDEQSVSNTHKSGAKIALDYAIKRCKKLIRVL